VPSRGGRAHSPIRARLLGNLTRAGPREVTFLGVLPSGTDASTLRTAERDLRTLARDEARGAGTAVVVERDDARAEIVERAGACDLMILGMRRPERRKSIFGDSILDIAEATDCPLLVISQQA